MLNHSFFFLVSITLINMPVLSITVHAIAAMLLDTRGVVCPRTPPPGTLTHMALSSPIGLLSQGWALNPWWTNQSPSWVFSQVE